MDVHLRGGRLQPAEDPETRRTALKQPESDPGSTRPFEVAAIANFKPPKKPAGCQILPQPASAVRKKKRFLPGYTLGVIKSCVMGSDPRL
jgi:hypothetical protein